VFALRCWHYKTRRKGWRSSFVAELVDGRAEPFTAAELSAERRRENTLTLLGDRQQYRGQDRAPRFLVRSGSGADTGRVQPATGTPLTARPVRFGHARHGPSLLVLRCPTCSRDARLTEYSLGRVLDKLAAADWPACPLDEHGRRALNMALLDQR
jgi:hypothetical protein